MANVTNQTNYAGTSADDSISGTAGNDSLSGAAGNDTLVGGLGNDTLTGGSGIDVAVFTGVAAGYSVSKNSDGSWLVTDTDVSNGNQGQKLLNTVEVIRFSDQDWYIKSGYLTKGSEFLVNATTAGQQQEASVAALTAGGYVITWQSDGQDGSGSGIYAQVFGADGGIVKTEFKVNSTAANDQVTPSVVGLTGGGFVVTWASANQDGSGWGVYAQRYGATGAAVGNEFKVNTYVSDNQDVPSVSALTSGGFVVTWESANQDGSGWGIYTQRYDSNGVASGSETRVNTQTSENQFYPSVASLTDGGYVVTWSSYAQDGSTWGIYAQRFTSSGASSGTEFKVNSFLTGDQIYPDVTGLSDGGFVITWQSADQDGSANGVFGQRYNSSGTAVGSEFRINSYTNDQQQEPTVTALSDGGFVVTWESAWKDGQGWGISGQRFDASGTAVGNEFVVNTTVNDTQYKPDVVALADGGFLVAWQSWNQDGNQYGVYAQRYQLGSSFLISGSLATGSTGGDYIETGAGNQTIVGGLGNDTVDGGAGMNTYRVNGTADGFFWSVNSKGDVILTDSVANDPKQLADTTDEGVDTLRNIQSIAFVQPDGSISSVTQLDDYGNSPDATNYQIQYGVWVNGRANFYGDLDYFKLQTTVGQKVVLQSSQGTSAGRLLDETSTGGIQGNETYIGGNSTRTITWTTTGLQDVHWVSYDLSTASPMSSKGYGFVLRRELDGTDAAETLTAGTQYEHLAGGAGNDTLNGSDRSDRLEGGDGNDVMTGGKGNDDIDGGSGTANVAVFSGRKADYSFTWMSSNDLGLTITDSVQGRDGTDQVRNAQILRFSDGDVVLDAESNVGVRSGAIDLGQTIAGTLPVGTTGNWLDQDYFLQKLPSSVTSNTNLRLTLTENYSGNDSVNGQLYVRFNMQGTNDTLVFNNKASVGSTISDFYLNIGNTSTQSWFISPVRAGGSDFTPTGQPLDVFVSGYAYKNGVSVPLGDSVSYSIRFDRVLLGTSGAETLLGDGVASYIDAGAGNDSVTGSSLDEQIVGGVGDDSIDGAAGNDVLVDSAGRNILKGGLGNDVFDVSGSSAAVSNTSPTDTIDGGSGTDTLKVASDTNFAGLSLSSVEVIDGSGGRTDLTPQQLIAMGFTTANNIVLRLSPSLSNGGSLDSSAMAGTFSIRGSNQSDLLVGNDLANAIYLNSDVGGGAGLGQDTVQAGGGDDNIIWGTMVSQQWSAFFSSVDITTKTYALNANLDGGSGSDSFILHFDNSGQNNGNSNSYWSHPWGNTWNIESSPNWRMDLSNSLLTSIENFIVIQSDSSRSWATPSEFVFTTTQINTFQSASGLTAVAIAGGGNLDLQHLADLGISNWRISDSGSYTLTGSSNADSVTLSAGNLNINLGLGDDQVIIDGKSIVNDTLVGGGGNDSIVIRGADVDLSGATVSGFESIQVSSQSLSMTDAQWQQFGSLISITSGTSPKFILTETTAGTFVLADGSAYSGLTGTTGNDNLTGNASDNVLVGGSGNDILYGLAGADRLVTGAGTDTLYGGSGDDTLVVTDKSTIFDLLSGGAGTDTLVVQAGQDLTQATLSDLEILKGSGTVTVTAAQLAGFQVINGVSEQLAGTSSTFSLGNISLVNGAQILMPQVDPLLTDTQSAILGSKGDDTIIGGGSGDLIYGGRGVDFVDGGAGNDTLIGGSGTDTLNGGAGDDVFNVMSSEFDALDNWATLYSDIIDGGLGSDSLSLNFSKDWMTYKIVQGAVTNVENLTITGRWTHTVDLTASTFRALSKVSINSSYNDKYNAPLMVVHGDNQNIDLSAMASDSQLERLSLQEKFNNIDASKVNIGPSSANTDPNSSYIEAYNFNSITLADSANHLIVRNNQVFTANLGAGDDRIDVTGISDLRATIEGGAGTDTLNVANNGIVDISHASLTSVEGISYGSSTIIVSQSQLDTLSFDGSGSKFIRSGDTIVGSASNDNYAGNGTGFFQGGKGDDSISNVNTVVFTGNYSDYSFVRNGNTLTVKQERGSLSDGTDTLSGVLNLKFADTISSVDDAPNEWGYYRTDASYDSLVEVSYGKRMAIKKDYASDTDVFASTLVPNSPLSIEASSPKGNWWSINFFEKATGQQIIFKSLVYNYLSWDFNRNMSADQKWLPGYNDSNNVFQPYQGGDVILQVNVNTDANVDKGITDFAFTLNYQDDYGNDTTTLGKMDAQVGVIKGYIGSPGDTDWIKTQLIAGTVYEFHLNGISSGGGSLVDPKLALMDSQGRVVESGLGAVNPVEKTVGNDDVIVFRPEQSGAYYLVASDVVLMNQGSWTLTQQSLDTIPGNRSSSEQITWGANQTFSVISEINTLSDHDWFKVWFDKGVTYNFKLKGSSSNSGTLSDPQLSVRSVTGILVAQNDNDGSGSDSSVNYSAATSGWYFLDAGASGNSGKGTYLLQGSTLKDDFSNDVLTTGQLQVGTPVQGLISYNGDSDWIKVGLSKGTTYIFNLVGDESDTAQLDPLIDPLLTLRDATGKVLMLNDDFGGALNSRIYFTPTADGLYYVEAKSSFKYDIGAYQLSVNLTPPDDFGNKLDATAQTLTLGTAVSGTIGVPGDRDVFQVTLSADKVYQINVSGLAGHAGTLVDSYIRVFDATGHLVDADNNGGSGNDAQLYLAPNSAGTYYIEASSANDKGMGTYQVSVLQRDLPPDDAAGNVATQITLQPGQSFSGNLLTHGDQDWVRIQLTAGQSYVFRLEGADSAGGTLNHPVLEIHAADGSLIQTVSNQLTTGEPAAAYVPSSSGTYYLAVSAPTVNTGTYTLVTRAPDDYSNTKPSAAAIALNQTLDGAIQWNDGAFGVRAYDSKGLASDMDEDWFQFAATKDQVLSFSVKISSGSLLSRPMVEIVDALGQTLSVGDGLETADGTATATFKAAAAGTFYARVIDGAGSTGAYQVTLSAGDASDEDASAAVSLSFASTGTLIQAQSSAVIGLPGDSDNFTINLTKDHLYRLESMPMRDGVHAPLTADHMALNFAGSAVVVNHDTGAPSSFDVTDFQATASGVMTINISALDVTQLGAYKVRVVDLGTTQADDRPDSVAQYDVTQNGLLAAGQSLSGKIDSNSDTDLFAINLTAGNLYDFDVKGYSDQLGTLAQADLKLLDVNGQLVTAGAFDAATGRNTLSVSVFDSGRYYLAVSAASLPGNTGTYTLDTSLRDTNSAQTDDIAANTRSGALVSPGKPGTGRINFADDLDWFKTTLQAGNVYVIDVLANGSGSGGNLKDSTLRLIDASGDELMADDNSGAGLDSHIQFTAPTTGDYYIEVGSNSSEAGTYTLRERQLYTGVADPLQSAQWYLSALGLPGLKGQITGAGIKVGVIDEGIDSQNADLTKQLLTSLAYDTQFNTQNGDPKYPPLVGPPDNHGTAVAGIIAAQANNETGIVGIAPDAHLVSTRVKWTWDQITAALNLEATQVDVSNNSWGAINPFADNFNSTQLTFAYQALRTGVEDGRQGLGTVFVFSAGNSAAYGDNTNYHNFQNAREVITVAATNQDGSAASFSTPGASVLVGTYGVGLLTTDRSQKGLGYDPSSAYTTFSGTSAAAPVVSGVVALMLEANPHLGYRDVQQILAYSADHPSNQTWKINGASDFNLGGLEFNDSLGFGLVNAYAAVRLAQTWIQTSTALTESEASARAFGLNAAIPDGDGNSYVKTFHIDNNMRVEHVDLSVDLRHTRLGDLIIQLTSPDGTVSTLMDQPTVDAENPFGLTGSDTGIPTHLVWDFSSVQFLGETASGDWTVSVKDLRAEETGTIKSLSLHVYGSSNTADNTYVFTEEGFQKASNCVLSDDGGINTINCSVLTHDVYVDLPKTILAAEGVTYTISPWSVIQNVFTGTGNDNVVGNDQVNWVQTFEGNDTIQGNGGNDTIDGGSGFDTVVFNGKRAEYNLSWDPVRKTISVVDLQPANGNDGTETLTNVEQLNFSDAKINLSGTVGNRAPVAKQTYFDTPVVAAKGMGIDFDLPDTAFTDSEQGDATNLQVSISDAAGGQLPSWLSFDASTRTFSGVPPTDFQGQIKILVTATDDFNQTTSDVLTLQFGDNQAPTVDSPSNLTLDEDSGLTALGLHTPVDPEKTVVTVKVTDIPTLGILLDKTGNALVVGSNLSADDLTEVHYKTSTDVNGDAGYFRYQATDAANVTADSSVHIFVNPVNDAPRFATTGSKLVVQYPMSQSASLDVVHPTDPESTLSSVTIVDLPAMGKVMLDGVALSMSQVLTLSQLDHLSYVLSDNVNGPVGGLTIRATDPQGLFTDWTLALEVQGTLNSSTGTAGNDVLYGSIGNDTVYGMAGDDTLIGNAGNDRLLGGLGNDSLFGGTGNDSLDGSSGNDYLDGGAGNDVMTGGPGNDTYVVESVSDVVLEVIASGAGGNDTIVTSVTMTAPANVENLQAAPTASINLTGNELDNVLLGNELDNVLTGGAGRDTLSGAAGNDTLDGGVGVDRMLGGAGHDTYYVDSRLDVIVELANEGTDSVFASSNFTLPSNVENLTLQEGGDWTAAGNSLDNYIKGNSGNNILSGGLGRDTLEGGAGNDIYILNDKLDVLIDVSGTDTIRSSLDVVLPEFIENGELIGIGQVNLTGNAASNVLVGNSGDNILDGLSGADTLTGGAGSDQFIISKNANGQAADSITDFVSGTDLLVIDLQSYGINPVSLGLSSSGTVAGASFVKGAGVRALDTNDYFLLDTAQGILKFDADGSGSGVAIDLVKFVGIVDTNFAAADVYIAI